jgi:hypothetical protein
MNCVWQECCCQRTGEHYCKRWLLTRQTLLQNGTRTAGIPKRSLMLRSAMCIKISPAGPSVAHTSSVVPAAAFLRSCALLRSVAPDACTKTYVWYHLSLCSSDSSLHFSKDPLSFPPWEAERRSFLPSSLDKQHLLSYCAHTCGVQLWSGASAVVWHHQRQRWAGHGGTTACRQTEIADEAGHLALIPNDQ